MEEPFGGGGGGGGGVGMRGESLGNLQVPSIISLSGFCLAEPDDGNNGSGSLECSEGEAEGKRLQQSAFSLLPTQKFPECDGNSRQRRLMGGKDAWLVR